MFLLNYFFKNYFQDHLMKILIKRLIRTNDAYIVSFLLFNILLVQV